MRVPAIHLAAVVSLGLSLVCGADLVPARDGRLLRLGCSHLPFSVCFAPDTDPDYAEGVIAAMEMSADVGEFQASDSARWSRTATDGGGLGRAAPTTLTWAVVPDGTPIRSRNGGAAGTSDLRARLDEIYGSESVWIRHFEAMFDRWEEISGVRYVRETSDDRATVGYASGQLGTRADIRIAGERIDGNSGVLAYNYFPNSGDMVIDTADGFYDNTSNDSRRLRNVLAHEHGHGLGFPHVCPVNRTKLMEPYATTSFDGPQHDDILAVQRLYGDRYRNNGTPAQAADLGALAAGTTTVDEVSIDGAGEVDVYAFRVSGRMTADVTLTPVGQTYDEGPQGSNGCGSGSSTNSKDNRNLAVAILAADGTTVLASADAAGASGTESIRGYRLPGTGGRFFVRVDGSGPDDVQLYRLTLVLAGQVGIPSAAADRATLDEDGEVVIDVLGNDAGLEDGPIQVTVTRAPSSGTATVLGDGRIRFRPRADVNGTDRFEYRIRDRDGETSTAAVDLTIRSVNDVPVARDDTANVIEGIGALIPVRANDTDVDGDALAVAVESGPESGRVEITRNGSLLYFPAVDSPEIDVFRYRLSDGKGGQATAEVRLTIGPNWRAGDARLDADGDHVPDDLERALGTDPANGASRPTTAPAGTLPGELTVKRAVLRLHRKHEGRDELDLAGSFPLPPDVDLATLQATVYVAGATHTFTPDGEPATKAASLQLRTTGNRAVAADGEVADAAPRDVRFRVRLRGRDFAGAWTDEGLGLRPKRGDRKREVTVYVVAAGRAFEATLRLAGRVSNGRRYTTWRLR